MHSRLLQAVSNSGYDTSTLTAVKVCVCVCVEQSQLDGTWRVFLKVRDMKASPGPDWVRMAKCR